MIVTLGQVIQGLQSSDFLGLPATSARAKIIDYINRGVEIAAYKCNWNPWLQTLDMCSNANGWLTLPSFVGTILAVNVCGQPTFFRNSWYEYHINGFGSQECGTGPGGPVNNWGCGFTWDDKNWSPTFQDLTGWSYLAAICEDPIDGNGSLQMIVEGETMDQQFNQKQAITIPATGPSQPGVILTLLNGYAATDPAVTGFKSITQVTKPVTRGYVKLIAFPSVQGAQGVTVGYYAPNETNPRYRRIRVSACCKPVRVRFRRATLALVNDYDIVPISSYQATLDLVKAIRLRETNNMDLAAQYEAKAIELLTDIQNIEDGPGFMAPQIDSFGSSTIDWR